MFDKAYIMTTPCSGKSTFVLLNENKYKSLYLFDHDAIKGEKDFQALNKLPTYSCIIGRNHKPNQKKYIYAIVLIEEEQLRKQIAKRKIQDPKNAWTEELIFNHPDGYYKLQQVAKEYNIPVFKTFEEALNFIIVKIIENE